MEATIQPDPATGFAQQSRFLSLPRKPLLHILGYLSPGELVRMQEVSHQVRALVQDGELWSQIGSRLKPPLRVPADAKITPVGPYSQYVRSAKAWLNPSSKITCFKLQDLTPPAVCTRLQWLGDKLYILKTLHDHTLLVSDATDHPIAKLEGHTKQPYREVELITRGDQECVISTSRDQAILWDLKSGRCIRTFEAETSGIARAERRELPGDRQCLLTISYDHTVRVWDLDTGHSITKLTGHTKKICKIWFRNFHDTEYAITTSCNAIRTWDLETGRCIHTFGKQWYSSAGAELVDVRDKPRIICISWWDHTAQVWDPITGEPTVTLGNLSNTIGSTKLVYLRGEPRILSTAFNSPSYYAIWKDLDKYDYTITIWDPDTGHIVNRLEGHKGCVNILERMELNRAERIVTASDDRTIRIWDPRTGSCVLELSSRTQGVLGTLGGIRSIEPMELNGAQCLVTTSTDRNIQIWDPNANRCITDLSGHLNRVLSARKIELNRTECLITTSEDRTVRIWDLQKGSCIHNLKLPANKAERAELVTREDGRVIIVTITRFGYLNIWEANLD